MFGLFSQVIHEMTAEHYFKTLYIGLHVYGYIFLTLEK